MKKILVALKDEEFLSSLIRTACALAKFEKAEMYLVFVHEVPYIYPLDQSAPQEMENANRLLDRAVAMAQEMDITPHGDIILARSQGAGILEEIIDIQADLLIMNLPGPDITGETFNYILKKAPCTTLFIGKNRHPG